MPLVQTSKHATPGSTVGMPPSGKLYGHTDNAASDSSEQSDSDKSDARYVIAPSSLSPSSSSRTGSMSTELTEQSNDIEHSWSSPSGTTPGIVALRAARGTEDPRLVVSIGTIKFERYVI